VKHALVFLAVIGCSKSAQQHTETTRPVALPKLGLTLDLAGKTAVIDESYGNGYEIRNPSLGGGAALHVAVLQNPEPPETKQELEGAGFTNVALDQGSNGDWQITSERADMTMGAKFFVITLRTIDGKIVNCRSTAVLTAAAHQIALAACNSLRTTR
jgi:hypothetical protein